MSEGVHIARAGNLPLFTSVRERRVEPEIMDQPELDRREHEQALAGLRRINAISATSAIIWHRLRMLARKDGKPLRVLELASGGGDTAIALSQIAKRHSVAIEVHGIDKSDVAVEISNRRAREMKSSAQFFVRDVLVDSLPEGYDVIFCSLFTHHLSEDDVERLLTSIRAANPKLVLINDLIRSSVGFFLAQVFCRILTRSYVVHYDGPRSVAAAFTMPEFAALADRAGLSGHRIVWSWPFRFLFTWKPK